MDVLTQTLAAVTLSKAGLNRVCPRAVWILLAAANAAELDNLTRLAGPEAYWRLSRGLCHSLLAAPLLALAVAAAARVLSRKAVGWGRALAVASAGVAVPLAGEWAGPQGVRLLWPFSGRWFRAGFLPDWDLWIAVILAGMLFLPWLLGLASAEIGARRASGRAQAIAALCLAAAFGFGRYLLRERAIAVLDSHLYEDGAPVESSALATPLNPFRWTGLVETQSTFRIFFDLRPLEDFDPRRGEAHPKPESRPEIEQARRAPVFQAFLGYYSWVLWRVTPAPGPDGGLVVEAVAIVLHRGPDAPSVRAVFDASGQMLSTAAHL